MAPRLTWSKLLPGLVAVALLVALSVGIVAFGGVGRISGEKLRLYIVTDQARDVIKGTPVWISGQPVGTVQEISFREPEADSTHRVVIAVDVRVSDANQIRHDSEIQVRPGSNIIGPIVVYVTAGTPASTPARDGDTLFARAQSDFESASVKLADVATQLGPLMADARTVMSHARNPNGTVGAVLTERDGGGVARLRAQVGQLRQRLTGGDAGASRAAFTAGARGALARADSIRALLKSGHNSFGRFRRDSTLGRSVEEMRDELARLRARLADNDGTLGRYARDSALVRSIAGAEHEMALLFEDIRKRPLRYIAF